MDIIFVVDRSGSIKDRDYDDMRTFLKLIGRRLQIGERDEKGEVIGQGAISAFSENFLKVISLKESAESPDKFFKVVDDMPGPRKGGRTYTHKGLALARKLATRAEGLSVDNPDVIKIFMVITDGQQTRAIYDRDFVRVRDAMKPFYSELKMNVFAIGVGLRRQRAINEVLGMVPRAMRRNAILAKDYKELTLTVEDYISKFCPG